MITVTLTGPWVWDNKRYERGESVTIPRDFYASLKIIFPAMFVETKKEKDAPQL